MAEHALMVCPDGTRAGVDMGLHVVNVDWYERVFEANHGEKPDWERRPVVRCMCCRWPDEPTIAARDRAS